MQKDLEYLYSSRKYVLAAVAVFTVSFIAGILISAKYPEASEKVLEMMKVAYGGITALDPFGMMIAIFKNNLQSTFIALLLGLGFGIFPFAVAMLNGLVLGILVESFIKTKGAFFVLAAILPHGILELPIVLISIGIGFRLGHAVYLSFIRLKTGHELLHELEQLWYELKQGIIFYIKIVVPLLLLAAVIESYITPLFISGFLK